MNMYSPALYQAEIFFLAICLGFLVGIILDIYRTLRNFYIPSIKITFVLDFILWIILAAFVIAVIMIRIEGEVYFFTYLGLVAGYFLYLYLLSKYALSFFYYLMRPMYIALGKVMLLAKKKINWLKKAVLTITKNFMGLCYICRNTLRR